MGNLSLPPLDNPYKLFYDAVLVPIVDLIEPQDSESVIYDQVERTSYRPTMSVAILLINKSLL